MSIRNGKKNGSIDRRHHQFVRRFFSFPLRTLNPFFNGEHCQISYSPHSASTGDKPSFIRLLLCLDGAGHIFLSLSFVKGLNQSKAARALNASPGDLLGFRGDLGRVHGEARPSLVKFGALCLAMLALDWATNSEGGGGVVGVGAAAGGSNAVSAGGHKVSPDKR